MTKVNLITEEIASDWMERFILDAPNKWACSQDNQLEDRESEKNCVSLQLVQKAGHRYLTSLKVHA